MAWDWNDIPLRLLARSGRRQQWRGGYSCFFGGGWSIALLTWPLFTSVFSKSIGILLWGPNLQQIRERERSSIGVCWRSYTVIPGPSVYVFPSQKYVSLDGSWRCASWEGGSWRHTETPPHSLVRISGLVDVFFLDIFMLFVQLKITTIWFDIILYHSTVIHTLMIIDALYYIVICLNI